MTETVHKQNSWENVQDFFHSVTLISRAGVVQMFWEAIHGSCPAKIWNLQTGGLPNKGRQGTESPIPFDPKGASCQVLQKATNDLLKALRWFMMYVEKFYANQKFVSTYIWMSMCMYIQAIWISIHYKQEEHFWCKGLYFKVHYRDLLSFTQVSSKFSSHGHAVPSNYLMFKQNTSTVDGSWPLITVIPSCPRPVPHISRLLEKKSGMTRAWCIYLQCVITMHRYYMHTYKETSKFWMTNWAKLW